ncbi:MAG TPA: DUF3224 domain-containing protein [Pseudonocardiaceae bacterium]|jgi:hypothetical protein|nr:DUF3224 domain-containing protein [Pseudonocardiaceae bacterium]
MTTSTETTHATGHFDLHDWQEDYYDQTPAAHLARVGNRKTFHGDITGTSTAQLLTVGVPVDGVDEFAGVAYVAIERITGAVHGRKGSFVLRHVADRATGMTVSVVAGSADGELTGLLGDLLIQRTEDGSHTYTFDYRISD